MRRWRLFVFYGAGIMGSTILGFVSGSWLIYFYLPPDETALIPIPLFGLVFLAASILGAMLTPYIGYLSDNLRNRIGHRVPLIVLSAPIVASCFYLMWTPPIKSYSLWNLIYLAGVVVAFRISISIYMVSYQAVFAELALSDSERVRTSAWQSGFLLAGFLFGGMAGLLIDKFGFQGTALVYAGLALVLLLIPSPVAHSKYIRAYCPQANLDFRDNLRVILKNRAFMIFAATWGLYLVTSSISQSAMPFLVTEVCQLGKSDTAYFYAVGILTSIVCYPMVTLLSDRIGKRKVYRTSLLASAVVFPGTMLIGVKFASALRMQCLSWSILQAVALSGAIVLGMTFVAEVTDQDSAKTGQRREGMYFAIMRVFDQVFSSIASIFIPLILLLGRHQSIPQGAFGIRLAGVAGGLCMFGAYLAFQKFTRENVETNVVGQFPQKYLKQAKIQTARAHFKSNILFNQRLIKNEFTTRNPPVVGKDRTGLDEQHRV
jgi:GPH family glycoside/pentoside/hexuronide:cation symporter